MQKGRRRPTNACTAEGLWGKKTRSEMASLNVDCRLEVALQEVKRSRAATQSPLRIRSGVLVLVEVLDDDVEANHG